MGLPKGERAAGDVAAVTPAAVVTAWGDVPRGLAPLLLLMPFGLLLGVPGAELIGVVLLPISVVTAVVNSGVTATLAHTAICKQVVVVAALP